MSYESHRFWIKNLVYIPMVFLGDNVWWQKRVKFAPVLFRLEFQNVNKCWNVDNDWIGKIETRVESHVKRGQNVATKFCQKILYRDSTLEGQQFISLSFLEHERCYIDFFKNLFKIQCCLELLTLIWYVKFSILWSVRHTVALSFLRLP